MGVTKNMAAWPVLASKSSHCHPASTISCYLFKSLCRCGLKIVSEIEHVHWLHHRLCSATPLDWVSVTNKNRLWGPSLTFHKNYPPYSTAVPWNHILPSKFCCTFKWPSQFCKHNVGARYRATRWILALTRGNKEKEDNQVKAHNHCS